MRPRTGTAYSEALSFELARKLSAVAQSFFSSSVVLAGMWMRLFSSMLLAMRATTRVPSQHHILPRPYGMTSCLLAQLYQCGQERSEDSASYTGKGLRFSLAAGPRLRAAVARSRCGVCCPAALAWKMLRSTRVPSPLHISPAPTEKMERTRKTYPWEVATCPPDRTYNISLCHGAPPLCLN